MNARPIIIDTTPGVDDAVAIALLAEDPNIDLKLISTVAGEIPVDQATQGLIALLTFLHKQTLVAKGAETPLMRHNTFSGKKRGAQVLDAPGWPTPQRSLLAVENAVLEERRVLMESDRPVSIVTFGPLTNIAMLLTNFPEVKSKIDQIIMMVGSIGRGDATVYGEFNAVCDPEAAQIVFRSQLPLIMTDLEIGSKIRLRQDDLLAVEKAGRVGNMLAGLLRGNANSQLDTGVRLCNTSAAMYLLEPALFTTRRAHVDVEVKSNLTLGATVANFDIRPNLSDRTVGSNTVQQIPRYGLGANETSNVSVCVDVDVCGFKSSFLNRLGHTR